MAQHVVRLLVVVWDIFMSVGIIVVFIASYAIDIALQTSSFDEANMVRTSCAIVRVEAKSYGTTLTSWPYCVDAESSLTTRAPNYV